MSLDPVFLTEPTLRKPRLEGAAGPNRADLSTLRQDAAGSVFVQGLGDPIGYVEDLSGNGNHGTQATDSARPILRMEDGWWRGEFDGTDDYVEVASSGSLPSVIPTGDTGEEITVEMFVTPDSSMLNGGRYALLSVEGAWSVVIDDGGKVYLITG